MLLLSRLSVERSFHHEALEESANSFAGRCKYFVGWSVPLELVYGKLLMTKMFAPNILPNMRYHMI